MGSNKRLKRSSKLKSGMSLEKRQKNCKLPSKKFGQEYTQSLESETEILFLTLIVTKRFHEAENPMFWPLRSTLKFSKVIFLNFYMQAVTFLLHETLALRL